MKNFLKIFFFLALTSNYGQDKDQTDYLIYCTDNFYLGELQINTAGIKKSPEDYSRAEIKNAFSLPLISEKAQAADENTGGNETYWDFTFKNTEGKLSIEIYDGDLPGFYLTHPDIPVILGQHTFKVGDSVSSLKSSLSIKGYKKEGENLIFIYLDYNVISFGIKDGYVKYIGFDGNDFN